MIKTKQEITIDILNFIRSNGGNYSDWYVGISKDARDRLFNGHQVDEEKDNWNCWRASSAAVAREIENYFVNTLGTDGGTGGGDNTANMVYCYKKSSRTNPRN